ncbi:MAG: tetratricopeptide repeat protein [Candidatus Acidiferrales bacterium]
MRRGCSQFALLAGLVAAGVAWGVLAAPAWGQQGVPPGQPATPAQQQQPAASPPASPARPNSGQDSSSQESSSKKDLPPPNTDAAPAASPAGTAHKSKPGVLPPEDDPAWDPFHAQQDIDVGMFYLHKGDVDAAISRFEDAIRLRANFAKPRLLLAQCYEKKDDPSEALRYYKEYLQVLPNAPDAKKVREKIEKLSKK